MTAGESGASPSDESPDEHPSIGQNTEPSAPNRLSPSRLRRAASLLLPLGLLLAASIISPHLPRDHSVRIELPDPQLIVGVNVHWIPVQRNTDQQAAEATQGSRWNFARGTAPKSLTTTVRLPKGAYDVAIQIERGNGVETVQRKIILGDSEHISLSAR